MWSSHLSDEENLSFIHCIISFLLYCNISPLHFIFSFYHFAIFLWHHITISPLYCFAFFHWTILSFIVVSHQHFIISMLYCFTISAWNFITILPLYHWTIFLWHHFYLSPSIHCYITRLPLEYVKHCLQLNISRISNIMFLQVSFNCLDNVIESLHISMSLADNNRDISLLIFDTEPFLVCITVF